jgi:hypothetical protein
MKGVCSESHCFACLTAKTSGYKVCMLSACGHRVVSPNNSFLKDEERGEYGGPELQNTDSKWRTPVENLSHGLQIMGYILQLPTRSTIPDAE